MRFTLRAPSFAHMSEIPGQYTCEGKNISPALKWSSPPEGTLCYALIVDDPDAPDPKAPRKTWVHWVLYNIPATTEELKEGVSFMELPIGTEEGINDWQRTGYGGPCPPIGRHRFFFKLYALSQKIESLNAPTKQEIEKAMEGHILAKAELIGTYQKKK